MTDNAEGIVSDRMRLAVFDCQLDSIIVCPSCCGYGYTECVAYYYGRAECSECGGSGVLGNNEDQ